MRTFIIADTKLLSPFNEPAKFLTVAGANGSPSSLQIHQKEVTASCLEPCPVEEDLTAIWDLKQALGLERSGVRADDSIFVYKDNIYFDEPFLEYFLRAARSTGKPCQAVLPANDPAWEKYTLPLSSLERHYPPSGPDYYPIEMYYFPQGWAEPETWVPVAIPSGAIEKGYYNIPDTMTNVKLDTPMDDNPLRRSSRNNRRQSRIRRDQDLTHFLSERTCVVIESWVHLFNASIPLGVFSQSSRVDEYINRHNLYALRLLLQSIIEQRQVLSNSKVVRVGSGTTIHPTAQIAGPAFIGKNCDIGPGVVIDNCIIGDNVTIATGGNLMLSVVGHNCFLPFRAALFMTLLMENTIVAQNTCLQMCVVGRNSFLGAGSTFTDFNLLPAPIKALNYKDELEDVGQPVLGGCVGHNCRIGAGMIVHPARTIESDVILAASPERRVIRKNITFEQSDHHVFPPRISALHRRLYPHVDGLDESQLLEEWT